MSFSEKPISLYWSTFFRYSSACEQKDIYMYTVEALSNPDNFRTEYEAEVTTILLLLRRQKFDFGKKGTSTG